MRNVENVRMNGSAKEIKVLKQPLQEFKERISVLLD